jgi:hypothetical protein
MVYDHCQCLDCKDGITHSSGCAVHNEPAYKKGPCDCGAIKPNENYMKCTQVTFCWTREDYMCCFVCPDRDHDCSIGIVCKECIKTKEANGSTCDKRGKCRFEGREITEPPCCDCDLTDLWEPVEETESGDN